MTLSGPIVFLPACCRYQAMLPSDPPKKLTPAPANVIFEVDAKTYGPVRVARLGGQPQHVDLADEVVSERVHDVGVVPEQPEIGCRGVHLHQPADVLPRVGGTRRVGEDGHAPHALDGRVAGDEFLDEVDVGAVLEHRHRDHLDAEALADREVTVVAGRRAEELDHWLLRSMAAPSRRRRAAARTRRCRASSRGWRCCLRSGSAPECRAVPRRWRAVPAARADRRSCGCRCPHRRGTRHPAGPADSLDRSSCAGDGLPRVRSRPSFLACRSA